MGLFRLYLAFAVLLNHAKFYIPVFPTHSAITAVQCFFVISGFYMAATYQKNYQYDGAIKAFYLSRFLRLYPLYISTLGLAALFYASSLQGWFQVNERDIYTYFMTPQPWYMHVVNLSMMFQDMVSINENLHLSLAIRQAWSISAEMMFYLSVPLIALMPKQWLVPLAAALFALKAGLFYTLGDKHSYFPFYGEIVYFVAGYAAFVYRDKITLNKKATIALLIWFIFTASQWRDMTLEWGGIISNLALIAMMVVLSPSLFKWFNGKYQALAGDLSYGVYIIHYLFIDLVMSNITPELKRYEPLLAAAVAIAGSLVLAYLFNMLVQDRIDAWRRARFHNKAIP